MDDRKLKRMLDQVTPSPEREEAMLKRLLREEREQKHMKTGYKLPRMAVAALAAVVLVSTYAGAVMTGLDQRLLRYFGVGAEQEELLSPAAVAVDKELKDQGAVLHVRQAIADRYSALILVDLTAPEGTVLDGDYYALGGDVKATAPDGTRMSAWGTGWQLLEDEDPADNHISLLLTVRALNGNFSNEAFNFLGARLALDLEGLYPNNLEKDCIVPGHWKCTVKLPEEDPGRYAEPAAPIEVEGSRLTLTSLYISPISLTWELGEGEDDLESMDRAVLHQREDWQSVVKLVTGEGESLPVGECNFIHTTYKTDLQARDEGRYSFRLAEIIDPAEVTAVELFGQRFSLAD